MIAGVVYILCALTSLACAILLWRGYRRNHMRLLFWSSLCFLGLALNNVLLYIDVKVLPEIDLSIVRTIPALIGVCCLIYGLTMECD